MPTAGNVVEVRAATLCLLNQQRAAAGLGALVRNETLESSAQPTAQDMVNRHYFAHVPPEGTSLQDKLAAFVRGTSRWIIGENLAWGEGGLATPANTMVAWMNSPGHRANILNGEFAESGVGVVPGTPTGSAGATYANHFGTREFAGAGSDVDPAPVARPATAKKKKSKAKTRRVRRCKTVRLRGKALRVAKRAKRKTTKRVCWYKRVPVSRKAASKRSTSKKRSATRRTVSKQARR